jgi:hypothetical protein
MARCRALQQSSCREHTHVTGSIEICRGTRRLMVGGACCAAVLFLAIIAWPLTPENKLGTPPGGANPAQTSTTTVGNSAPAQRAAESTVGKNDPAGLEDSTGGKARAIQQSARPLQLDEPQRQQIKDILGRQSVARVQNPNFEMMIGASVPAQIELRDLPPEITQVMNGYWGDQYVLTNDKMVIIDQHSRRVVAIIPTA